MLGRCCRIGQTKQTRWYVLWVKDDVWDEVNWMMLKCRIAATEAMNMFDSARLNRARKKAKRDDGPSQIQEL